MIIFGAVAVLYGLACVPINQQIGYWLIVFGGAGLWALAQFGVI